MFMKRIGIVSYNIHCNFTNYGSALQTWALNRAVTQLGHYPILLDYCPDILKDKDPLNPMKNMWDTDEESKEMCELSLEAIEKNYYKFEDFYSKFFNRSREYLSENFEDVVDNEKIDGFICGSDTIFCIDEFGFDDGYYANYSCMKKHSVSYAASFGDSHFSDDSYRRLNELLGNFNFIGLRENDMIEYVKSVTKVPVYRTIDPTLLLTQEDYDSIAVNRIVKDKYLLLYARRYNPIMEQYAERIASENGWKIVEISLRAINKNKPNRIMFYEAGVEEFLSLVKYSEHVVTNSFHGMIFAVQYKKIFDVFSREQCDTKIEEVLQLFGLQDRLIREGTDNIEKCNIDYEVVHNRIKLARDESLRILEKEIEEYI